MKLMNTVVDRAVQLFFTRVGTAPYGLVHAVITITAAANLSIRLSVWYAQNNTFPRIKLPLLMAQVLLIHDLLFLPISTIRV